MPTNNVSKPPEKLTYKDPRYFELYANNVNFESSIWDLKMLFAVLEQDPESPPFRQLCAVRIPWAQAKLMAYYLFMNIVFQEERQEKIHLPESLTPKPIEGLLDDLPNDDKARVIVQRIQRMRAELGL